MNLIRVCSGARRRGHPSRAKRSMRSPTTSSSCARPIRPSARRVGGVYDSTRLRKRRTPFRHRWERIPHCGAKGIRTPRPYQGKCRLTSVFSKLGVVTRCFCVLGKYANVFTRRNSAEGAKLELLGYQLTGPSFTSPLTSQTCRSRSYGSKPSRRVPCHLGSCAKCRSSAAGSQWTSRPASRPRRSGRAAGCGV
jgi:hypothetical protein